MWNIGLVYIMKKISLNGKWRLYWRNPQVEVSDSLPDFQKLQSINAQVPGNVEIDLQRARLLPDIFFGNNIWQVKPFETAEWWYVREFDVENSPIENGADLVFAGLDCIAIVWLNGKRIGSCSNMFIEHKFDVTDYLKVGSNEVVVHIQSALLEAQKRIYDPCEIALSVNYEGLSIRKAPHMYGWDIMPRLISAGLWRDVSLQQRKCEKIIDVYYHTRKMRDGRIRLNVDWQIKTSVHSLRKYQLRIIGHCKNSKFEKRTKIYAIAGQTAIDLEDPYLWWPRGYGKPNLYEVSVQLFRDGQGIDERVDNVGVRWIKLDYTAINSDEKPGRFIFLCNGRPIMIKGSNHVPLDALHSRDRKWLDETMCLYDDLGCNMIRCWGGNVYEDHEFFDFCDRHGIMVWQDFAFACAGYPQTEEFFRLVSTEVEAVVRKLRNHCCIVIWSGDNEVDASCHYWGLDWTKNRLNREIIPAVVARCDPYRQYIPSSPYLSDEVAAEDDIELSPEQHLWGKRDYYKNDYYSKTKACFASETGWHGCPNINSMKRFLSEDKLWPWENNSQWITHSTNPCPDDEFYKYRLGIMAKQIGFVFGFKPERLEDFVTASQIVQAEADKYLIELFRISKWQKSGIIWWNLRDGWPQFSDAVVDYYFGKKLAYYYIMRVQQPVCIIISDPKDGLCNVICCNDTLKSASGDFKVTDADTGRMLAEGEFEVDANVNKILAKLEVGYDQQRMFLVEYIVNGQSYGNHYMSGKIPLDFKRYRNKWLKLISLLPDGFDYDSVGK